MAVINIVVDDEVKAKLDAQATAEQRTLKAVVVRALEQYFAVHVHESAA